MECFVLCLRIIWLFFVAMELLIGLAVHGVESQEMENFPPKFNHNHKEEEHKDSARGQGKGKVRYSPRGGSMREDSIELSKILEFIDIVKNNSSLRSKYCKNADTKNINLDNFTYKFTSSDYTEFSSQQEQGIFIANILTDYFSQNKPVDIRHLKDVRARAIVSFLRLTLDRDTHLLGAGIAFANQFFPYVYRTASGITDAWDIGRDYNFTAAPFYKDHLKDKRFSKRNELSAADTSGRQYSARTSGSGKTQNVSFTVTEDEAFWTQPYFDCVRLHNWVAGVSLPFYEENGSTLTVKGVVLLEIDLLRTRINQCEDSHTLFANSHKCQPETTKCVFVDRQTEFVRGNYECHCRSGFYFSAYNATPQFFRGIDLEEHFLQGIRNQTNFSSSEYQCLPCKQGCIDCADDSPCFVEYNILMRGIPLGIQSFCMTITLVLGIVVLRFRKSKVMVISMWVLLEIILIGALFLYATVVIQYFEPSTTTCLIVPWLREVGFAILYGALILKIYRLLADFQSRKAHRVHVRDKDLLKYLLCIVVVVIGYMAAWTAVNFDHVKDGQAIIDTGITADGDLRYFVCRAGWWDYSTEIAELLFLCFGIYLCYRVRAAPSEYSEGTYVSAAICYECFISSVFYALRHVYWLDLHPDYLFLMYFLRCQLTVTVTLLLVFGPKLWYAHRPPDDIHMRSRAYSTSDVQDNMAPETMKLNVGISSNGDVDIGEVSLADMDPEDIRAELKRLYTQLQIYKTRNMRKDNPHISKRRGGRKQTHRRFSLQPFHHKHRHHHDRDHEHEMSKTPEESTNSAEGVQMPMELSISKCDDIHEGVKSSTTVSFKMSHSHK